MSSKTHSYSLRNFLAASKLDTRLSICIIWQIFEKTCVHFELYRLNAAQGSLAFKATANRERAFTLEDTQEKESLLSRPSHDNAQEILRNIFSNIEEFPIFIKNQPVNIGLEEIEKL